MIVRISDDHPRVFFGLFADASNALLQIGRILVAGQNGDDPLASQNSGQFAHHLFTAQAVIHAVANQSLGGGRIRIKGDHGHSITHRFVDGVGHLVGIAATDGNSIRTRQD